MERARSLGFGHHFGRDVDLVGPGVEWPREAEEPVVGEEHCVARPRWQIRGKRPAATLFTPPSERVAPCRGPELRWDVIEAKDGFPAG